MEISLLIDQFLTPLSTLDISLCGIDSARIVVEFYALFWVFMANAIYC